MNYHRTQFQHTFNFSWICIYYKTQWRYLRACQIALQTSWSLTQGSCISDAREENPAYTAMYTYTHLHKSCCQAAWSPLGTSSLDSHCWAPVPCEGPAALPSTRPPTEGWPHSRFPPSPDKLKQNKGNLRILRCFSRTPCLLNRLQHYKVWAH